MKTKNATESMIAAWCAWTKARYGFDKGFADYQARLWLSGVRDSRLHDVTCCVFEKYFYPMIYT